MIVLVQMFVHDAHNLMNNIKSNEKGLLLCLRLNSKATMRVYCSDPQVATLCFCTQACLDFQFYELQVVKETTHLYFVIV